MLELRFEILMSFTPSMMLAVCERQISVSLLFWLTFNVDASLSVAVAVTSFADPPVLEKTDFVKRRGRDLLLLGLGLNFILTFFAICDVGERPKACEVYLRFSFEIWIALPRLSTWTLNVPMKGSSSLATANSAGSYFLLNRP